MAPCRQACQWRHSRRTIHLPWTSARVAAAYGQWQLQRATVAHGDCCRDRRGPPKWPARERSEAAVCRWLPHHHTELRWKEVTLARLLKPQFSWDCDFLCFRIREAPRKVTVAEQRKRWNEKEQRQGQGTRSVCARFSHWLGRHCAAQKLLAYAACLRPCSRDLEPGEV